MTLMHPHGPVFVGGIGPIEFLLGNGFFGIGFIVLIAILLMLRSNARSSRPMVPTGALEVLEERYARGEITRDEFFERRSVLLNQSGVSKT